MEKTKIEWCDSSWNPVTGCRHTCEYCYARRFANRYKGCIESPDGTTSENLIVLPERRQAITKGGAIRNAAYPYGFTPTLHEYRLSDPLTKSFGKTIFVCSMADLFGEWIPDEWIERVFDACKAASNHRYLFLTKNPKRYIELAEKGKLPEDDIFWYGSTATDPNMQVFFSDKHHTFVSIEPVLAPFVGEDEKNSFVGKVDWAIFGAETGNRKEKTVPRKNWIEEAVSAFRRNGKAVFMKDSLIPIWGDDIITEFPWDDKEGMQR